MMPVRKAQGLRGELRLQEPLASLTSWRVGGKADRLFKPADAEELSAFLAGLPLDEPITWLGLGSNVLVRDAGVRGTVIAPHGALGELRVSGEHRVTAQVGVPCAKVARFCAKRGLTGAEFLAGIPGTIGGALAMNAGAFGGETWEHVVDVETIDRQGVRRHRAPSEFQIGYRSVSGPAQEWFLAAEFQLEPGDPQISLNRIRDLLARRGATQPTGVASCGSVFRNPEGDHAGRLIEAAGLKGHCIGGACVSEKHANFIVNLGQATAADIEALIEHVRDTVERRFGVRLIAEVRIIGEVDRDD